MKTLSGARIQKFETNKERQDKFLYTGKCVKVAKKKDEPFNISFGQSNLLVNVHFCIVIRKL